MREAKITVEYISDRLGELSWVVFNTDSRFFGYSLLYVILNPFFRRPWLQHSSSVIKTANHLRRSEPKYLAMLV